MKANTRLVLSVVIIVGSAGYGFLVLTAPSFAEAIALGYISVLLTAMFTINFWKG
jgi:hypothetical protein